MQCIFTQKFKLYKLVFLYPYYLPKVSVHELAESGHLIVMKGAPERILDRCSTIVFNGVEQTINQEWQDAFNTAYLELGGLGERVLGFCDLLLPRDKYPSGYPFDAEAENFPLSGMRLVGVFCIVLFLTKICNLN